MSMPVRLLDEEAATEVAGLREQCRRALTNAADACGLRFETNAIFEQKWPVRRSEVPDPGQDPYGGEVRPRLDRIRTSANSSRGRQVVSQPSPGGLQAKRSPRHHRTRRPSQSVGCALSPGSIG